MAKAVLVVVELVHDDQAGLGQDVVGAVNKNYIDWFVAHSNIVVVEEVLDIVVDDMVAIDN